MVEKVIAPEVGITRVLRKPRQKMSTELLITY